jgi:thiol reductant ABC exporter CydD subunit
MAAAVLAVGRAVAIGRIGAGALHGEPAVSLARPIAALAVIAALSAAVVWAGHLAGHRASARVIHLLRLRLIRWTASPRRTQIPHGELAAAGGAELESLDPYVAGFLPDLVLAALVPPAVVGWMATLDPWSAVIVGVTLPLIPGFAALIGAATRGRVARRWDAFAALGAGILEAVRSLPVRKAFGRAEDAVAEIAELAEGNRRETIGVLRLAFVSALALELAATISVAVIAVAVGLRVLGGNLELEAALTVLVLAPEAYLPLRRLASDFHASAEGTAAAGRVLDLAPAPLPPPEPSCGPASLGRPAAVTFEGVGMTDADRPGWTGAEVSFQIPPGAWVALTGPSGSGKSTLLHSLLGLVGHTGTIRVDGRALTPDDRDGLLARSGWVPQDPHLFDGSIADNVRFGDPSADDDRVREALAAACAGFVADLPDGAETQVGERGAHLSAGERARIALARALVRSPDLLVLDEPTAHLDADSERAILGTLTGLRGRTTIVFAAHRPAAAGPADLVVRLGGEEAVAAEEIR